MSDTIEDWNCLTKQEQEFVLRVMRNGSGKYAAEPCTGEDDTPLWENPEAYGFIVCRGTYKWGATNKVEEMIALLSKQQTPVTIGGFRKGQRVKAAREINNFVGEFKTCTTLCKQGDALIVTGPAGNDLHPIGVQREDNPDFQFAVSASDIEECDQPFSTGLTNAQSERLSKLTEEMGEALQMIGKTTSHGYESVDPTAVTPITNRKMLETELGHVLAAIDLLTNVGDLDISEIQTARTLKKSKMLKWCHFQS